MVKKYNFFVLLTTIFLNAIYSETARILAVFPTPSISHQVVFRPIIHELAKRHEVVVITTDPVFTKGKSPANLTEIDVHDLSYAFFRDLLLKINMGNKDDIVTQTESILKMFSMVFKRQIKHPEIQKLINDKTQKFDLLLLEACIKPAIVFSHIFKAPVVLISSLGAVLDNNYVIGASHHPLRYPAALRVKLYNLTMWDKIKELYYYWKINSLIYKQMETDNEDLKKEFGLDLPTLIELNNNVHMLLVNLHALWAGNNPVPPSAIFIGGIHQTPQKSLPKDLETFLNASKHGVIYFSLGTNNNPSLLPRDKLEALVKAFASLPYDVLWKYDKDELPISASNIRLFKWLPQSDLLRHPNIKLFITQGGLQSTDEAITAGVPVLGIPMLADQFYNVEQYVHHKLGLRLDMDTLTEHSFKTAIETIIKDKTYRKNMNKIRILMTDQPQTSLERGIWWIEHVLRHGGAEHLRSPAANLPLTEFLELNLIIAVLSIITVVILILCTILYVIWKTIKKYNSTLKIKKN